ncbi:hypothetical protein DFJ73DRAFT_29778 [Zopfochytrium polystomum]|nr:hypothetical protein DFJ73DRAFT_29778 [Zopfochytrium polystomum]
MGSDNAPALSATRRHRALLCGGILLLACAAVYVHQRHEIRSRMCFMRCWMPWSCFQWMKWRYRRITLSSPCTHCEPRTIPQPKRPTVNKCSCVKHIGQYYVSDDITWLGGQCG